MKNGIVNNNVLKAISLGLSAAMLMANPMSALADGTSEDKGLGDSSVEDKQLTEDAVASEQTKTNETAMEDLGSVKEEYNAAADEIDAENTEELADYGDVVTNISEIEAKVDDLNEANDAAAKAADEFDDKLKDAQDAIDAADDADAPELVEEANTATEQDVVDAQAAEKAAEEAKSRAEVNQAAEDADAAADKAEEEVSALEEALEEIDADLTNAETAVQAASDAHKAAQTKAETAQKELDDLLEANGLGEFKSNSESIYTLDEDGNVVVDESLLNHESVEEGDNVAKAIAAALAACEKANEELVAATETLESLEGQYATSILEWQEKVAESTGHDYWVKTRTLNEYMIRYYMVTSDEFADVDMSTVQFGKWTIDGKSTYENENFVPVTYLQAVRDSEGNYVLGENGEKTYEQVTKYYNYHREDGKVSTTGDDRRIAVFEKEITGTETVTSTETYEVTEFQNADGSVLETTEEGDTTSYTVKTTDEDGNVTETAVDGRVEEISQGEREGSLAILGDVIGSDGKLEGVDEKSIVDKAYEYVTERILNVGASTEKEAVSKSYYTPGLIGKSWARDAVKDAFEDNSDIVVEIKFADQIDGEIFHWTHKSVVYTDKKTADDNFFDDVDGLLDGNILGFAVFVHDAQYDIVDAVKETVSVEEAIDDYHEITGNRYYSESYAKNSAINKLEDEYRELYPGCTFKNVSGKGFTVVLAGGREIPVEYSIDVEGSWRKGYKATVKGGMGTFTDAFTSETIYRADLFTETEVTKEREVSTEKNVWTETLVLKESQLELNYEELKNEAQTKASAADELYEELVKALDKLLTLQAATNVSDAELSKAQEKVEQLRNDYNEAKEAAKTAQENAEEARRAADHAAELAAGWTDPVPATPNPVVPNPAPTEDDDDNDDTVVIEENQVPQAPAVAAPAATPVTQITTPAAVADDEQTVTEIAEEETPLAPAIEQSDDDNQSETVIIGEEETPTVAIPAEEKSTMNWWWLLVVMVLGATGYEMYKKHQEKTAKKDETDTEA